MKQKLIFKLFILTAIAVLITGCTQQVRDPMTNENAQKLLSNDEKFSQIETRLSNLEANQLTAEDIKSLANLNNINKTYLNITNVSDGCPSDYDVNVKWFEILGRGDITQSQYDKILNKYNECKEV